MSFDAAAGTVTYLPQSGSPVVGSTSGVSRVVVLGGAGDDVVDVANLPTGLTVIYDGGAGANTIGGPSSSTAWSVTGADSGSIGAGSVSFSHAGHLVGAAGNRDTFTLGTGGSLSGLLDGGAGGYDTLVVAGSRGTIVSSGTDAHSGTILVDGTALRYTGLEPIAVSGGVVTVNQLGATTVSATGSIVTVAGGGETVNVDTSALTSLSITSPGTVTVGASLVLPGVALTIQATQIIAGGVTIDTTSTSGNGDITLTAVSTDDGSSTTLGLTASADAEITLNGTVVKGGAITFTATATSSPSATTALAVATVTSTAKVSLTDTHVTAHGDATLSSGSTVTATVGGGSTGGPSWGGSFAKLDVTNTAQTNVSGSSTFAVDGALQLNAATTNNLTVKSDARTVLAGAAIALVSLDNTTTSFIDATTSGNRAHSLTLSADGHNTVSTESIANPAGAATTQDASAAPGTTTDATTMTNGNSFTATGPIGLAAALSYAHLTNTTTAYIRPPAGQSFGATIAGTDGVTVHAANSTTATTSALGATLTDTSVQLGANLGSVGTAVAIAIAPTTTTASVGGTVTLTTPLLVVEAPASDLSFPTTALAGHGDASKVAFQGSLALNVVTVHQTATLEPGAILDVTNGAGHAAVQLRSEHSTESTTVAKAFEHVFDPMTAVQSDGETIVLPYRLAHNNPLTLVTTGTKVTYKNGFGLNIGGLTYGGTYYLICPWSPVFLQGVCSQTAPTFRLATSSTLAHLDGFGNPGGIGPDFAIHLDPTVAAGTEHIIELVDDPEGIGIGAGVAVNVVNDTGSASIGNGATLTGAGDLTLSASTTDAMELEAKDGSAGGIAITPVVAVGISNITTAATIGTGALLILAGTLDVTAEQTATLSNSAIGETEGKSVSIGASVSVGDSAHTVIATTARNISAVGSATFTALSTSSTSSYAYAGATGAGEQGSTQANAAGDVNKQGDTQLASANQAATHNGAATSKDAKTPTAGTQENGGGSITVAAAISFNLVTSTTDTSFPAGLHITVTGGPLTLTSQSNTDALATADGEAGAANATAVIGAGVALNLATMSNTANVGPGAVVTTDGVTLSATVRPVDTTGGTSTDCAVDTTDCKHSFQADGISAAGLTGTLGVAGSVGINIVNLTTSAQALSNGGTNPATIHAGTTSAPGDVSMTSGSDAATSSSATPFRDQFDPATHVVVGVDGALDTIVLDYELATADGTPINTGDKVTYFTDGGDPVGGLYNNTFYYAVVDSPGHIRLNWLSATAAEACAWDATLVGGFGGTVGTCLGIVTLDPSEATGTTHYLTFGSDAAPTIGIGASFAFSLVNDTSTAGIQNGVVVDGVHDLALTADSGSEVSTLAVSGASGKTTVGATVALTLANLTTTAFVGTGAQLDLTGNLEAEAAQAAVTETVTRGDVDAESVGVGVALSLALVTNDVEASVSRNVHADGDITLTASGSSANTLESEASAPGAAKNGNTVNGFADSVLGHGNSTASATGSKGSGSSSTPKAATSDEGGASLSVAGAVAIAIVTTTSSAWLADGLTVVAGEGPLTLASSARTATESKAKGDTATATSTGVGAGVVVNLVVMHNIATTGASHITAQGLVVTATMTPDPSSSDPATHTVSAGATAGASNTSSIGVAGALALNIIEMRTQALVPSGAVVDAGSGDVVLTAEHREADTAAATSKAGFATCPVNNEILCTIKAFLPVSGTNTGTSSGSAGGGNVGNHNR